MPSNRKKNEERKAKEEGRRESEARQLPEHSSPIFKKHFLAKFPGANGLMKIILMAIKKIIFQTNFFQQHHILLTGVVS